MHLEYASWNLQTSVEAFILKMRTQNRNQSLINSAQ